MLKHAFRIVAVALLAFAGTVGRTAAQTAAVKATDFCALLTMTEAGAVLGAPVTEATPMPPQGSLLGGCNYPSSKGLIMLNARPAAEFDRSVKAYPDLMSVEVAGAKAFYSPKVGLLMNQTGKPYFLHVTMVGGTKTAEIFINLAKKILAK